MLKRFRDSCRKPLPHGHGSETGALISEDLQSRAREQAAAFPTTFKHPKQQASTRRAFRGGWGQRAWKDQPRSLGNPPGRRRANTQRECITVRAQRVAERPVVAKKRGNACGAKGPY